MSEDKLTKVRKLLEDEQVQAHIQKNMQRAQDEAQVTIGRAAELFRNSQNKGSFEFTEAKLREWDRVGLVKSIRMNETTGQRRYPLTALHKLAILRELVDEGCDIDDIPVDVDELWQTIVQQQAQQSQEQLNAYDGIPINQRVDALYHQEVFWRYYTSRILLLSLMLVYEDIPNTYAGLILPRKKSNPGLVIDSQSVAQLGESLVSWLDQNRSVFTFLTNKPFFEYPSDFRVLPLHPSGTLVSDSSQNDMQEDHTLVVVQRDEVKNLSLTEDTVRLVRRLLAPLYELPGWHPYFGFGMRDYTIPGMDFSAKTLDVLLSELADMVIRLGGRCNGEDRWRFCCILLPRPGQLSLPLQQRSLAIRAQSKNLHPEAKERVLSPDKEQTGLSLRAYQSGHIMYRFQLSANDTTTVIREIEGPILSNIAVPIGGENGHPRGVLYVASDKASAFPEEDQRILRIISRIAEELLTEYEARQKITSGLKDLVKKPATVDPLFADFPSENDFLSDLNTILTDIKASQKIQKEDMVRSEEAPIQYEIQEKTGYSADTELSFISIDIDDQESIASKYGDEIVRHLNKAVGVRIQELLPAFFTRYADCTLYHIYADEFRLLLKNFTLEEAKEKAIRLRKALDGSIAVKLSNTQSSPMILPTITVHLGVTSYPYWKLQEILENPLYPSPVDVITIITHTIDIVLKMGMDEDGGNIIYAWNREGAYERFKE